jgi:hypothetical protein
MSATTERAVRLVKAQGVRDAAAKILGNRYSPAETTFERSYNFAMNDAAGILVEMAEEMEKSE